MAKFDIEQLLFGIDAVIKAKLPAIITALNTEKNDSITLDQIDNAAFYVQGINENLVNYKQFIVTSIVNQDPSGSIESKTKKQVEIFVTVFVSVENTNDEMIKKLLRYTRALEDLINANWDRMAKNHAKAVISTLPIASLDEPISGVYYNASGVGITAVFS